MDLRPPLPPSSSHTLASEATLFLAYIDMAKEEARFFSIDNHGTHRLGAMESNLLAI
jgi:hypothetical protein